MRHLDTWRIYGCLMKGYGNDIERAAKRFWSGSERAAGGQRKGYDKAVNDSQRVVEGELKEDEKAANRQRYCSDRVMVGVV